MWNNSGYSNPNLTFPPFPYRYNGAAVIGSNRHGRSRWVKNDYTLVDWPPDRDKDKAAGIRVVGEEDEDDPTPGGGKV